MRPIRWSSVINFVFTSNNSIIFLTSFFGILSNPKTVNMQKLIVLACVIAVAYASPIGIGLPGAGYGYIGGLTKLPNLGFGNVASVNSNQNTLGYQLHNVETGPLSVRSHTQSQIAPLGVGFPVLGGYGGLGYGIGLGGGIIG